MISAEIQRFKVVITVKCIKEKRRKGDFSP